MTSGKIAVAEVEQNQPKDYAEMNRVLFLKRAAILDELENLPKNAPRRRRRRLEAKLDSINSQIVTENRGLVLNYVNRFVSHTSMHDSQDFEGAGLVGLVRAINSYDPERGSFAQWAYRPIKREVLKSVHATDYPNMNVGDFERRPDILRARDLLVEEEKPVTEEAVAEISGATLGQVRRVLRAPQFLSLSSPAYSDDADAPLADIVGGEGDPAEGIITQLSINQMEDQALPNLTDREKFVLVRRYGLDSEPAQRLSAIGTSLGLSREAARQIEARALAKLSHPVVLRALIRHENAAPGTERATRRALLLARHAERIYNAQH